MAPAIALVAGAELALRSETARPLLAVALVAAASAVGGRPRACLAAFSVGLLAVWVRPAPALSVFDLTRPVTLEADLLSSWQSSGSGWSAPARARRVTQGSTVRLDRSRLWVGLSGEERPVAGRRIRARGLLRVSSPAANGAAARPPPPRIWVKSRRLVEIRGKPRGGQEWVRGAWHRALGGLEGAGDGAALARALVLGDRGGLSRSLEQGLRRAGLAHLLALSGLHVGLLATAGHWAGRLLGIFLGRRFWKWLPPMACAAAYLVVVGPRPSILRASLMAMLAWAAVARGGSALRWNSLAMVLGGMVLWSPRLLRELSFQLTAAATAGVLFGIGRGADLGRSSSRLRTALRVSVAAQSFTLPWAAPSFHLLPPAAPIHNLWAVPWIGLALFVALGWTLLALVCSPLAAWSAGMLELGVLPFGAIGRARAGPWWSLPVGLSPALAGGVACAAVVTLRRPAVAAALLTGLALAASAARDPETGQPEIAMLDVGQGEALILRDGDSTLLVDGGGWSRGDLGARVLVPALGRLGVRRLDALALTHPDVDHCRGLADVSAYLPVTELWTPAGWGPHPCWLDLLSRPAVRWRPMWAGRSARVGRWQLEALHPAAGDRSTGNNRSLVLRAEALGFRALLTGDIEAGGERALLKRLPAVELSADLLKIAHHGGRSSSDVRFLQAVAPRLAWISSGRANRYGHPAPEVLARLRARGIRVLRTDRDGMIVLRVQASGGLLLSRPGAPPWSPVERRAAGGRSPVEPAGRSR